MKSSPVIELSFSGLSSAIIAGLLYYQPEGAELYTAAVPLVLTIIVIAFKYLAVWLQILDYETYSAVSRLKYRKKLLGSFLNDPHLSKETQAEHRKEYENVTLAIDTCLRNHAPK